MRPLSIGLRVRSPDLGVFSALLCTALAAVAFHAGPAQAALRAPVLSETSPLSPGISETPRIVGRVSEVITSGIGRGGALAGSPTIALSKSEEGTIAIYAEPGCAGPEVATGSEVELADSGIQVTVAPGSTTTFSAAAAGLGGVSGCSNGITYRQVSAPPSPPTVTAVNPVSPGNDDSPDVIGNADADAKVSIYSDPGCLGAVLGTGTGAEFSAGGISASVPSDSTTTFYAAASWAGLPLSCSSTSVTYQEVASSGPTESGGGSEGSGGAGGQAPSVGAGRPVAPRLHTVPGGRSNNAAPLVTGSAPGGARVDVYRNSACSGNPAISGSAAEFSAGLAVPVAENAMTRIYAQAVGADGDASDCSEPALYTEDSTPPLTQITFGPGAKTHHRAPVFRFADVANDPPGTSFSCRLDGRAWAPCQSPWRLPRLRPKAHRVQVRAIDAAGNREAIGARFRFKVVTARR
jgi:hypothetical protein